MEYGIENAKSESPTQPPSKPTSLKCPKPRPPTHNNRITQTIRRPISIPFHSTSPHFISSSSSSSSSVLKEKGIRIPITPKIHLGPAPYHLPPTKCSVKSHPSSSNPLKKQIWIHESTSVDAQSMGYLLLPRYDDLCNPDPPVFHQCPPADAEWMA